MDRPQAPHRAAPVRVRIRALIQRLLERVWPDRPTTWPGIVAQVRPHAATITRLTAATVVSYLVIHAIYPEQTDLTGALTALLVVQASSTGTLKMGMVRVGAVLSGVVVAVLVATFVGLSWWSLGLVVSLSLAIATLFRLHAQLHEAGISAMLILGSSAADQAGEVRLVLTLIGAAIGMAFGLLLPAGLPISLATSRVRQVGDQLADQLSTAGEALAAHDLSRPIVDEWISGLRSIMPKLDEASEAVAQVSEGRVLNARALADEDVGPLLRTGLDTLENCLLSARSLFVQIRSEIPAELRGSAGYDADLRAVFAVVMQHGAEAIRGFAALVDAEAHGREDEAQTSFALSLEMLREAQAILTELMMTDTGSSSWLMRGSILSSVQQVLHQLDLETRSQVHAEWAASQSRRFGAHLPVLVREALPQAERPLPKLLERGLQHVTPREVGAVGVGLVKESRRVLRKSRRFLVPALEAARAEAEAWNQGVDEMARRAHGVATPPPGEEAPRVTDEAPPGEDHPVDQEAGGEDDRSAQETPSAPSAPRAFSRAALFRGDEQDSHAASPPD